MCQMLSYINKGKTYILHENGEYEVSDVGTILFDYIDEYNAEYDMKEVVKEVFKDGCVPSEQYIRLSEETNNKFGIYNLHFMSTLVYEKNKIYAAYKVNDIVDIAFLELVTLIMNNSRITKCKRCGRMFVLRNNHNSQYCDRIDKELGVPCSRLGSAEAYREKITKNVILQEYQKAYKRLYARARNGKMEQSEFDNWVRETTVIRDRMAEEFEHTQDLRLVEEFAGMVGN